MSLCSSVCAGAFSGIINAQYENAGSSGVSVSASMKSGDYVNCDIGMLILVTGSSSCRIVGAIEVDAGSGNIDTSGKAIVSTGSMGIVP